MYVCTYVCLHTLHDERLSCIFFRFLFFFASLFVFFFSFCVKLPAFLFHSTDLSFSLSLSLSRSLSLSSSRAFAIRCSPPASVTTTATVQLDRQPVVSSGRPFLTAGGVTVDVRMKVASVLFQVLHTRRWFCLFLRFCSNAFICIHTYTHVHAHVYNVHVRTHVHTHAYVRTHMKTYIRTHTHVCTYT